jgi:hypothetical protein
MPTIKSVFALLFALLLAFGNTAFAQQFALQGVTSVVVRNVGGAGGRIGVNQLGEASARDRLMLGFFTWNPIDQIIQEPTLHVRYDDFKFIAGFQQPTVLYVRRDTAPGGRRAQSSVIQGGRARAQQSFDDSHATRPRYARGKV